MSSLLEADHDMMSNSKSGDDDSVPRAFFYKDISTRNTTQIDD